MRFLRHEGRGLSIPHLLQCNELNRDHPTFFVAPFIKYLVSFSLMETNFSPQVPHLRLLRNELDFLKVRSPTSQLKKLKTTWGKSRNERALTLLFWTRLVIGRKTLGGPGWVRYTVMFAKISLNPESIWPQLFKGRITLSSG